MSRPDSGATVSWSAVRRDGGTESRFCLLTHPHPTRPSHGHAPPPVTVVLQPEPILLAVRLGVGLPGGDVPDAHLLQVLLELRPAVGAVRVELRATVRVHLTDRGTVPHGHRLGLTERLDALLTATTWELSTRQQQPGRVVLPHDGVGVVLRGPVPVPVDKREGVLPLVTTTLPLPLLLRVGNRPGGLHQVLVDLVAGYPDPTSAQLLVEETCPEPLLLPDLVDDTLLFLGQGRAPGPPGPVQTWNLSILPVLLGQLSHPPLRHPVLDGDLTDGPVLHIHDVSAEEADLLVRELCHLGPIV